MLLTPSSLPTLRKTLTISFFQIHSRSALYQLTFLLCTLRFILNYEQVRICARKCECQQKSKEGIRIPELEVDGFVLSY